MKKISYLAMLVTAVFTGTQAYARFLDIQVQHPNQTLCQGWAAEIGEISSALHEQIDGQKEAVTSALYDLETLAEDTCAAEQTLEPEILENLSKVAKILRKELIENKSTKKAERTLAFILLKLIERSTPVALTKGR